MSDWMAWLGLLTAQAAEHIYTDMQQYVDFAGLLYTMLVKKPAAADIEQIVRVSGRRISHNATLAGNTHTQSERPHDTQHAARSTHPSPSQTSCVLRARLVALSEHAF